MLEDLDTMWNLWYTHKLPFKWWLEDRSDPCTDLMDRPGVKKMPPKKRNEYFGRMAHQTHVEIFCKSYEYERYLVRSNRGDNSMANWNRPSELGHVHRIPLKLSHFDLHPDGDPVLDESAQKKKGEKDHAMDFDGDGDALNSLNAPKRELNDDQRRKEEVIERNQQQLNAIKEQQRLQVHARREALRIRGRVCADSFDEMLNENTMNQKEIAVNGDTKTATLVRGIDLDEI